MQKIELDIKGLKAKIVTVAPFFGFLLLSLEEKEWETPTWATDGETLFYNLNMGLTQKQYLYIMIHEVEHYALLHSYRKQNRNAVFENQRKVCPVCKKPLKLKGNFLVCSGVCNFHEMSLISVWNVATDIVINNDLNLYINGDPKISNLIEPPPGVLVNDKYKDMSAEKVYDILLEDANKNEDDKKNNGRGKDGGAKGNSWCHGVLKNKKVSEENVKHKIVAAATMIQGNLPGEIKRLVEEIINPKINWATVLSNFIQETKEIGDYTWERPQKKYVSQGLYLPDNQGDFLEIAVGIDTSGSISPEVLCQDMGEIIGICKLYKKYIIHLLANDAEVGLDFEITESVGEDTIKMLDLKGGGGTDFRPVFQRISERHWPISCLVFLTDAIGTFPSEEPNYPVIWVVEGDGQIPFGTRIQF